MSEQIWKFSGGPGKLNTLCIRKGDTAGRLIVTLQVEKPGCEPWSKSVEIWATVEQMKAAVAFITPRWVLVCENDEGGVYTAMRLLPIPGAAAVLFWNIKHTDVNRDGTKFTVEDELHAASLCFHPTLRIPALLLLDGDEED